MLQDLIKKAQELCAKAELKIKEATDLIREYNQKIFGLAEQDKQQKAKDAELKAREEKVKHIEDVDRLHKEANGIMDKVKTEKGLLAIDKANFEEHKNTTETDLVNRKALIVKGEKELAEGRKKLNEDRAKYRSEVITEITSKMIIPKGVNIGGAE